MLAEKITAFILKHRPDFGEFVLTEIDFIDRKETQKTDLCFCRVTKPDGWSRALYVYFSQKSKNPIGKLSFEFW